MEWIRIMYAYPSHFPEDVIDVIANNDKICNYIDNVRRGKYYYY